MDSLEVGAAAIAYLHGVVPRGDGKPHLAAGKFMRFANIVVIHIDITLSG